MAWWIIAVVLVGGGIIGYWLHDAARIRSWFSVTQNSSVTNSTNTVVPNVNVGTTPASLVDSDHDGLSNDLESLYTTDPSNPDTDGDGYKDGEEVANGYDPLTAKTTARMIDLALVDTIAKGDAAAMVVSSGLSTADHERYYLLYDGTSTSYYATDGTLKAQCPVNSEPSGTCMTLPNQIRTDFSRTFADGKPTDSYHVPF